MPLIAVTPGDPEGVGPDVFAEALLLGRIPRGTRVVAFGASWPYEGLGVSPVEIPLGSDFSSLPDPGRGSFYLVQPPPPAFRGSMARRCGFISAWSAETAARLALEGRVDALVTGPISKERINLAGYAFPGHTELLASLCGERSAVPVTMMLANAHLRVALVTTHLPLSRVAGALDGGEIERAVDHSVSALRDWWGIRKPRIAVCALNPHAGEGGLLGLEEIRVISPAIRRLKARLLRRAEITGPHPADTVFAMNHLRPAKKRFDAVVCMYHDQGLIPVKLLDFAGTVNISLGLPIIRTSVDHGVAFDLARTGRADPSSFIEALALASRLAGRRRAAKNKPRARRRH